MSGGTASVLARLIPPLRPEWRRIVGSYVLATTSLLALAAIGVLAALGVGGAVVHGAWPPAVWWVAMVVLVLLRTLLTWREMDVSHALAYRVLARLRVALFDAYARSVPARRREHSGRAASVAMTDIEKLEFFYAHTLAQIGASVTLFVAALGVAAALMPAAALVMVSGAVLVALTARAGAGAARRVGEEEQVERERLSERLVDALGALREILAYGLQDRVVADAVEGTRRSVRTARRRELLSGIIDGSRELILTGVLVGVVASALIVGGVGDARSAALAPAVVALAVAGVAAIADAAHTLSELHPLVASAARVDAGLRRPPVVAPVVDARPLPAGPLGIRFRDVEFSYDDRTRVLRRWSAEVHPGEHVGIAGPSGAGKSTVIALAARLWDPDGGEIALVDGEVRGMPLREVSEEDLRAAVAVVEQDARLFHGSVRENLLRGTGGRSDAELVGILDRVGARDWISLDDELGEHGVRLSGGQRARLALARALCREPRILIVDEITASLDPATERAISQVLAEVDATVIVASHRRETLERLERVLRVDPPFAT
ncbi:ABC transporter ATP-binding protein [Microbacterium sp. SORGH_AS_0454]|uniref:ATP-binding cassette domain-containing protein n=1 Tax=Microbacterium sp. SORGH_AS_0454 TaxID=3041758 RepID=UPI001AEACCDC|nr:ABC transporter ATP-binding protein [Microbacterium sp. SORGH_AS_0454]MDR6097935.1 ABC-type multidrug transport system fused ATPase/permease subunit [Microbacterium sp. SORGH_AS_0454]